MASNDDKLNVGKITEEELSLKNQQKLRENINKTLQDELALKKALSKLSQQQVDNATKYQNKVNAIKNLEDRILQAQASGNTAGTQYLKSRLQARQAEAALLAKTEGGSIKAQQLATRSRFTALKAERDLIRDINKERGIGSKIADLFRSKEARQRQIDIARAQAGGGANVGDRAAGGAGAESGNIYAMAAAKIKAGIEALKAPFKAVGAAIKNAVVAPLNEAAALIGGGGFGIGGGRVSGAGATSMVDGVTNLAAGFASIIPIVGPAIGMLVNGFGTVLKAILGINQAQVNFARNQGISLKQTQAIRAQFQAISLASNNVVVNQTRLLESQAELSGVLGVTNTLSASILSNDVKMNNIAGLELEARQKIAETSIITGENAEKLTKNILGQVGYVKKVTGLSFNWKSVLSDVSKLTGVVGLQFAKYPKEVTNTLLKVKTLGFEMKQLRDIAGGLLDFENSIAKAFEAEVLTGKELNLTLAYQAALNNDYATLSAEITKNVGSTTEFLAMSRFEQDSIAEAVGMTADGLADVLKKQDMYKQLGASNLKDALAMFEVQNKTAEGRAKLVKELGEENYGYLTQTSIAERLSEIMTKIKQTFIDFVEKSKIFDFLTNEKRVNQFIQSLINGLAGAIDTAGNIIAGVVELIGKTVSFFSGDDEGSQWMEWAESIRGGAGSIGGSMRKVATGIGDGAIDSDGTLLISGPKGYFKTAQGDQALVGTGVVDKAMGSSGGGQPIYITVNSVLDGQVVATNVVQHLPKVNALSLDGNTSYYS